MNTIVSPRLGYKITKQLITLWLVGASQTLFAQSVTQGLLGNPADNLPNRPLFLTIAIAGLALVPFVLIMVTSFVKIAVVLSVVRQAIGTQQIPPTQVVTGLAIVMTTYIMAPVGIQVYDNASESVPKIMQEGFNMSQLNDKDVLKMLKSGTEPLRGFLTKHCDMKERVLFYRLGNKLRKRQNAGRGNFTDSDFLVLIPGFVISELKDAFKIGFILFVPFLVIDMVVANILMALGMQMLSPTTISLPFKILLFVLVDGWYLISKGLIMTYF